MLRSWFGAWRHCEFLHHSSAAQLAWSLQRVVPDTIPFSTSTDRHCSPRYTPSGPAKAFDSHPSILQRWRAHSASAKSAGILVEEDAGDEQDAQQAPEDGSTSTSARAYHLDQIEDAVVKKDQGIFALRAVADKTHVDELSAAKPWYLVLHAFGVATFVGSDVTDEIKWVHRIKPFTENENPEAMARSEELNLSVDEDLVPWSVKEQDCYRLQRLDIGNIRVISLVLAQSVALNHYTRKVDQALDATSQVLHDLTKTGVVPRRSKELISLIAQSQLLYTDVIRKLGVIDMNDSAWRSDRHHDLWQSLRAEYELDLRLEALERKTQPIIENAKFILEMDNGRKTMQAEKWIIILIATEICLSVLLKLPDWFVS